LFKGYYLQCCFILSSNSKFKCELVIIFFTGPVSNVDTNNFHNLDKWQLQIFARELVSCMALRTAMEPTMNISRKETPQKEVH